MTSSPEYLHSELPAIDLFRKMGYGYYDGALTDERETIDEVILADRLQEALKRINRDDTWQISEPNVRKAVNELKEVHSASLMESNQKAWNLIRGAGFPVKQVIGGREEFKPVWYIDYRHPENNDFLVVNQMKFHGSPVNSIPDITLFVNGIPVAVIECKSPTSPGAFDKAAGDLAYYQKNSERLFRYNQICAAIYGVGGRYGAIGAGKPHYSFYRTKETAELERILGKAPTAQEILLYNLFRKDILLDIIRHFVLFELEDGRTIKKLPRYPQIRATNKAIAKLQSQDQGGVIWHTQGSGKSLTMVYITRKLQADEFGFNNPTVIVMTDRIDLDRQITATFRNCGFKNVHQASSVVHLEKLLKNDYGGIITTTLYKFQERDKETTETTDLTEQEETKDRMIEKSIKNGVLTKITNVLEKGKWVEASREEIKLEELSRKENLYVMVDEAHRSHYGFIAAFMRSVLPKAKFLAFTGTPISKEDKSTLGEFYGGEYIDRYTIKESVEDGATVELLYDEGIARLDVKKEELDAQFEEEFGRLPEEKQDKLKSEALNKYQLSRDRIDAIARHIADHYTSKIRPDGHKAMIVCDGRPMAIRYQETLLRLKQEGVHDLETRVVISLGAVKSDPIALEVYRAIEYNKTHEDKKPVPAVPSEEVKAVIDDFKLPFGDETDREKSGKKRFDNTAILIVSDMLLTGYDVPVASCLYLDKPLKEHSLLQAIARVNRSREGKKAGFIVDYFGITSFLIQALEIFSGDLKASDILKNLSEEIPRLEMHHAKLVGFFKPLGIHRGYERDRFIEEAIRYIEPVNLRDEFKELLKAFNRSIAIVLPDTAALRYTSDCKLFNEIKIRARNAYPEDAELKISSDESLKLQGMVDEHLKAMGVDNLLQEPISIIDKDKFREEILNASPATKELKMRNNLRHVIRVGMDRNPDFYKPLAQRMEELIKARDENRITQLKLLEAFAGIQDTIINEDREGREKGFERADQITVFNTMKGLFGAQAEQATRTIFTMIEPDMGIVDWHSKGTVRKEMENKISRILREKMDRSEARQKAREVVELIARNQDA